MSEARFVYVIYIHTTPEKLWSALIDPEMNQGVIIGVSRAIAPTGSRARRGAMRTTRTGINYW